MSVRTDSLAESGELLCRLEQGVVWLTLNRPRKRNALSLSLLGLLQDALQGIARDPGVRVVVLAAAGSAFSSGHDLGEMRQRSEADYRELFASCTRVMQSLRQLPQPVIARVQGPATAAGCQLVAACDLAIATAQASFATPGVKIGLFCTTPMVPLVRAIPAKPALEMLLTGQPISAERAMMLGLVNDVVSPERLDGRIAELAQAIMAFSPAVIRLGKRAFYDQLSLPEDEAYGQAVGIITQNALLEDAQEGIAAFLQKRPPRWTSQ